MEPRIAGVARQVARWACVGLVLVGVPSALGDGEPAPAPKPAEPAAAPQTPQQTMSIENRPQTPRPPFPYASRDVSYVNPKDGTRLSGTLVLPAPPADAPPEAIPGAAPARHPAAVLITGSGAQDRDETLFGHKPFLVIADHLARHGIATLRVDDRGVGGSSGSSEQSTSLDFAGDVRAGLDFLKTQPEIDPARLGLIGHSEGGIIAPLVAQGADDVAFVVLLAATAFPGRDILAQQLAAILRAGRLDEAKIQQQIDAQQRTFAAVGLGGREAARPAIRELIVLQAPGAAGSALDTMVEQQLDRLMSPWFLFFLSHDPRPALGALRAPTLALNGSVDLQVLPGPNLGQIRTSLEQAGNPDATVLELPSLNHLFQTATSGAPGAYPLIKETFAPAALDVMTAWIRQRTGLDPRAPGEPQP